MKIDCFDQTNVKQCDQYHYYENQKKQNQTTSTIHTQNSNLSKQIGMQNEGVVKKNSAILSKSQKIVLYKRTQNLQLALLFKYFFKFLDNKKNKNQTNFKEIEKSQNSQDVEKKSELNQQITQQIEQNQQTLQEQNGIQKCLQNIDLQDLTVIFEIYKNFLPKTAQIKSKGELLLLLKEPQQYNHVQNLKFKQRNDWLEKNQQNQMQLIKYWPLLPNIIAKKPQVFNQLQEIQLDFNLKLQLSDQELASIVKFFPVNLQKIQINIENSEKLTDKGLQYLGQKLQKMKNLQNFSLKIKNSTNSQLTNKGIHYVLYSQQNQLQNLDICLDNLKFCNPQHLNFVAPDLPENLRFYKIQFKNYEINQFDYLQNKTIKLPKQLVCMYIDIKQTFGIDDDEIQNILNLMPKNMDAFCESQGCIKICVKQY
ncbi:hypothetical protein PPERSA_12028 [Pseudocohnilembus persalinus]|uniref:Uncharacterized protein n=1 Tax=Pseudocohnilembus persalinus TaxID=266149 RepID=A0A0V0R9L1_PSEPJ|nr:hypothetical protein PPERSA_12028 [Pseudocohnilembus persalinus]|eukprot:KRX10904.1 hypothetical protein PPERSA_12028 [Pseudocohnilembus persalinus]